MVKVFRPEAGDALSVRHIHQTEEDRKTQLKEHREQKEYQENLKRERFDKIEARRKKRDSGGGAGKINIEVKGD